MSRVWSLVVSMRTTLVLLGALALLLLLNVVLPQAAGATEAAHDELVRRSAAARFVLVTLELGSVATSRIFLVTLVLFFLNLAGVLMERAATTFRRARFRAPTPAQVRALADRAETLEAPAPAGLDGAWPGTVLARLGYRVFRPDATSVWGVKNRTASIGFLLFHASFFVVCAGAMLLYQTRSVATVVVAEGQTGDTGAAQVVRRAPWMTAPPFRFVLERVDVRLVDGKPVQLDARIRPEGIAGEAQTSRVNHPAVWGALSVLVDRAGVVPVLWVQDGRGFTLDRVAVITAGDDGAASRVPIAAGRLEAEVEPIRIGTAFPEREALRDVAVTLRVKEGDRAVYSGTLRPGEVARVGDRFVKLEEVRYWVSLRLVHERGGGLLIGGFVALVVGLVWRMLWYRREVAIVWDGETVRFAGRAEFFPARFGGELETIRELVLTAAPERERGTEVSA